MDFVDQTLTQAEKDEIERLQRELTSTKRNLQELEEREAAVAFELDGAGHDPTGHLRPDFGGPIPPAEIEMVRAAVIHENKTKYNFESLRTIEGKSRVESVAENFLKPYYAVRRSNIILEISKYGVESGVSVRSTGSSSGYNSTNIADMIANDLLNRIYILFNKN